ncbi:MAG: tryptophan--tRNA ligase [Gemmatimonadetes bacterium]|nr:MAG: tryptophan--tRNA ligase [Gemmatimonadota bacterium]
MAKRGKIFSGMRPTGKLHIGHLLGALENWVVLQDEYDCVFGIVDWHAMTTGYTDLSELPENVREMAIDWLAAGIDPEKSIVMRQSFVKEHAELHLILSMVTPTPWLIRNPTLKEQARDMGLIKSEDDTEMATIDYGYLGYPVLQSADILLYKADTVPVGADQVPHIEISREIARRFNHIFGAVFPEPQAKLTQTPRLAGVDGRKMSKSLQNCIYLDDDLDTIVSQTRKMVTDPQKLRKNDPGRPEVCSVFEYHTIFNPHELPTIETECKSGALGCVACKKNLAERIDSYIAPCRERRREYAQNPEKVDQLIQQGSDTAREIAQTTMKDVRKAVHLV